MSKRRYPVIDYTKCTECGICVTMCKRGAYDKFKAPAPNVIHPEGCIEGCHGCGKRCPNQAITYVGEQSQKRRIY